MSASEVKATFQPSILLFGPQCLSFDRDAFHRIRAAIIDSPYLTWILKAIEELPDCLELISTECLTLDLESSYKRVQDFVRWFEPAVEPDLEPFVLPNVLLSPLTVIGQLIEYFDFIERSPKSEGHHRDIPPSHADYETLGLCMGMLSASAVSSSTTRKQLEQHGGVALRLAMLIGAVVDAEEGLEKSGPTKTFATVWNTTSARQGMERIMKNYPEVRAIHLSGKEC